MKILRVGDPHITVRNIPEAQKLIEHVYDIAWKNQVNRVEFMGDLFHTHAVVRVEVLDFWKTTFMGFLKANIPVLALVGNHDQPGSKEKEQVMNSLNVFSELATIIDRPRIIDNIAYAPYMSDHNSLIEACERMYQSGAKKLLVAHQTFTGAQYENGFYAEDGLDPAHIAQDSIISGHIHMQQEIGKCFYIGTPKWDTMSDANEDKGIWLFEHASDGSVLSKEFFSTKNVVTPIYKHVLTEGENEPELIVSAKNYIELRGQSAWIKKMKKKYKGIAQIKAVPTDRKMVRLESTSENIYDFLKSSFQTVDGVSKEQVNEYLRNKVGL